MQVHREMRSISRPGVANVRSPTVLPADPFSLVENYCMHSGWLGMSILLSLLVGHTTAYIGSVTGDEEAIRRLFEKHHCQHLYLDVGSNLGVQIRKLFEPWKYSGATVLPVFNEIFGPAPRCHVCAIGIEPNPRHAPRHAKLVSKLRQAGAGVVMLPGAVGSVVSAATTSQTHAPSQFRATHMPSSVDPTIMLTNTTWVAGRRDRAEAWRTHECIRRRRSLGRTVIDACHYVPARPPPQPGESHPPCAPAPE